MNRIFNSSCLSLSSTSHDSIWQGITASAEMWNSYDIEVRTPKAELNCPCFFYVLGKNTLWTNLNISKSLPMWTTFNVAIICFELKYMLLKKASFCLKFVKWFHHLIGLIWSLKKNLKQIFVGFFLSSTKSGLSTCMQKAVWVAVIADPHCTPLIPF